MLGAPRSGTTLLAEIVSRAGFDIGRELPQVPDIKYRREDPEYHHLEDRDFYNINAGILKGAKGTWWNPPQIADIFNAADMFKGDMRSLISRRQAKGTPWGWKDPRNSLTATVWNQYLDSPKYIIIRRLNVNLHCRSLETRLPETETMRVRDVIDRYKAHLKYFRLWLKKRASVFEVAFEDLTSRELAPRVLESLARFLGVNIYAMCQALDWIDFIQRDH